MMPWWGIAAWIVLLSLALFGTVHALGKSINITIEDRVSTLEKNMEACCGTEFRNPDVEHELAQITELRRKIEEHEMRLEVLER